jgi:putative transposase
MSRCKRARRFPDRVQEVIERLRKSNGLDAFQKLLPVEIVHELLAEVGYVFRERLYTPAVTLWVFLSQVLSSDHSCSDAVARLLAWRTAHGERPCSPETGAYCSARGRLPEQLYTRLVEETGAALEREAKPSWRWKRRVVKITDGTTFTMPDTAENQAVYPQQRGQKPGLGLPIARMVVLFSLTVGTVLKYALGPYQGKQTGENQLFRGMLPAIAPGDVVLGDRYYGDYCNFALVLARQADLVTRLHHSRKLDLDQARSLGRNDYLVVWRKPDQRPDWMDKATYATIPQALTIRVIRVQVAIPGFRVRELVLTTSLLDAKRYTPEDLAALYRARWCAELHLRSLKSILQMDHLRCETPEMVRKELAMHFLGYNLLRSTIAEAARHQDLTPGQISFKGALQTFKAFREAGLLTDMRRMEPFATLLAAIASHRVGDRPNRVEPRAVKRRPKPHDLLTVPRDVARNRLLQTTKA